MGTNATQNGARSWGGSRRTLALLGMLLALAIASVGWVVWSHTHPSTPDVPYTVSLGSPTFSQSSDRFSATGRLTNIVSHPVKFKVVYFCNPPRRGIRPFEMQSRAFTLGPGRSTQWTVASPVLRFKSNAPVPRSKVAHLTWVNCAMSVETPGESY